jgi:hypothetical protein
MAGKWFVRSSTQLRFVGIGSDELVELRDRANSLCRMHQALRDDSDPAATEKRIQRLLDGMAEEVYPAATMRTWMAGHPIVSDPRWRD